MKRNIISILLVFSILACFVSCKKLPEGSYEANGTTDVNGEVIETTTMSPELESFLSSFDTSDPAAIEEQFEQMLDTEIVEVELEFGDELVDDSNANKVEVELDSDGKPKHEALEKDYADIVNGDKFTMDVTIKNISADGEISVPMVAMRNGDEIFFEAKMPVENKGSMKFNVYLSNDGNCYIILPSMRWYMAVPGATISDLIDTDLITEGESPSADYVESLEVEINGKTYLCDVYEDGDVKIKYYYDDTQLKRVETINGEDITIMEINEVSETSDASKFVLPKGYVDLTTVLGEDFNLGKMY